MLQIFRTFKNVGVAMQNIQNMLQQLLYSYILSRQFSHLSSFLSLTPPPSSALNK